jgi:hypothetical protein
MESQKRNFQRCDACNTTDERMGVRGMGLSQLSQSTPEYYLSITEETPIK